MSDYISVGSNIIELTEVQAAAIVAAIRELKKTGTEKKKLSEFGPGEVVKIGEHEMIVLEQSGDTTALIRKNVLSNKENFGESNNYNGSHVDGVCNKFAEVIASIVGEKNLVEHTVDLTSDDGLKDYGKVRRRASLMTCDLYRRYVDILDQFKPDEWWWLATAFSTKRHDNDYWGKCVSPSGSVNGHHCDYGDYGVRPFCILKSDIFVSQ